MGITSVFFRFRRGLRDAALLLAAAWLGILVGQVVAPRWTDQVTALVVGLGVVVICCIGAALLGERAAPKQPTMRDVMDRLDAIETKVEAVGLPTYSGTEYASASIGATGAAGPRGVANVTV